MFVYDLAMSAALRSVVDELVVDASGLCDSEMRARFIEARREIDRLESYVAARCSSAHGREVPVGEGCELDAGVGAVPDRAAVP